MAFCTHFTKKEQKRFYRTGRNVTECPFFKELSLKNVQGNRQTFWCKPKAENLTIYTEEISAHAIVSISFTFLLASYPTLQALRPLDIGTCANYLHVREGNTDYRACAQQLYGVLLFLQKKCSELCVKAPGWTNSSAWSHNLPS